MAVNTSTSTDDFTFDVSKVIKTRVTPTDLAVDDLTIIDSSWITARFMVSSKELETLDAAKRFFTTTQWKFTDTSLGGHIAINPRPQFTRYCDIRGLGRNDKTPVTVMSTSGNMGMGRYYSEALDDNIQVVFLEFGIPKFNSLIDFFTRAIDYEDSYIANNGRLPVGYKVGQFLGDVGMLIAFPAITLSIWAVKIASKFVFGSGSFDYYYLEPAMHMYWGAVNNIVTTLATEMGVLIPQLMPDKIQKDRIGMPIQFDKDDMAALSAIFPNLISSRNYIDVYAIVSKAQQIANIQLLKERALYDEYENGNMTLNDYTSLMYGSTPGSKPSSFSAGLNSALSLAPKVRAFTDFLKDLTHGDGLFADRTGGAVDNVDTKTTEPVDTSKISATKFSKETDGTYKIDDSTQNQSYLDKFVNVFDSTVRGGGGHAVFAVDYTGPVTESFSNSIGEISIGDTIKSGAGAARNIKFNLAGGNIAGSTVQGIMDGAVGVLRGTLDSVSMGLSSVISTITGNGFIDIPKKWNDSDMSLPSINYSMTLISPYGNVISQLQNIYIPLAMLLAGTLPLSAGKSSYTSPFICSLFCKGVQNIKLGMITSLSITRGTSNLGFNSNKRPLALEVSFTVTDFSTRLTAPVNKSIFDTFSVALEDETPLGNYLAVLGSRDLLTSKYTLPKLKLRISRALMSGEQMLSPASWAMRSGQSLVGDMMSALVADHSLTANQLNQP